MFKAESTSNGNDLQENNEYRQTQALHEHSPLLLPKSAAWNGLRIEHHRQPPAECDLRSPQHIFCILLNNCHIDRSRHGGHVHSNCAQQGEVILHPASSSHWARWHEETEFLLLFLEPSLVAQIGNSTAIEIMESEKEFPDPLLLQIGLALKAELDEDMVASSALYAESLATALSAHLLRRYAVQRPIIHDTANYSASSTIRRAIEYVHDHPGQPLTLAELSTIAEMSPYHFSRAFKQATGIAPHQYVLHTRIEHATGLLQQGTCSIAEVARRVGFFDQSHFTRYFKRIVGVTPQTLLRQKSKNVPDQL